MIRHHTALALGEVLQLSHWQLPVARRFRRHNLLVGLQKAALEARLPLLRGQGAKISNFTCLYANVQVGLTGPLDEEFHRH